MQRAKRTHPYACGCRVPRKLQTWRLHTLRSEWRTPGSLAREFVHWDASPLHAVATHSDARGAAVPAYAVLQFPRARSCSSRECGAAGSKMTLRPLKVILKAPRSVAPHLNENILWPNFYAQRLLGSCVPESTRAVKACNAPRQTMHAVYRPAHTCTHPTVHRPA